MLSSEPLTTNKLTMNTERIKEIQKETAYPDSVSVQQALLKVWNETEQSLEAGQHETIVKYPKHNSTEMTNYLLVNALRCLDNEKRHILTKNLVERDTLWED